MPPHHPPEPRPQSSMPSLRSQPAHLPATSAAQLPHAAARGLPMRPALRSNPAQPAVMPQPPQEFVELETMMSQVIRNASMGTLPSNHQLFTLNRMITTQLQSSTTNLQRSALMRYQQQLREISSAPRHRAAPAPITSHVSAPPSAPPSTSQVPGPHVSATLTNLLRAMPPGLLQSVGQPSRPPPSARVGNLPSPAPMPRPSGVPRRLPDAVAPLYSAPSSSTVLTFADLKGMSHHAGVRSLYTDLPYLSKSDGMRFATKEALREHLDWLFRQNRRKRGTKEQVVVGGQSRGWFDTMDAFLGKVDPNAKPTNPSVNKKTVADENDDRTVSVVESKSDNDICAACHEAFETFWDDDKHAWMLRDCTKTDDDELYHVKCMQYAVLAEDESAEVAAQLQPEDEKSKPENESSSTALTSTNNKPLETQTNTNSETPQEPSTTANETAALAPTVKEEPQRAFHNTYNQHMVSQMSMPKAEPNMISVHSQGVSHLHAAAHVMPPKQEPLMPVHGDIINNRPISMQGLNMVPPGNMAGPDMNRKVIISKVPKWLAATTGIQVMALEPARTEEPRAASTSPPSGQKRKRLETEGARLDPSLGILSANSSTLAAPSLPTDEEAVEPQSKRQKECNPQTNT
ncbi:hypothetical protein FGB62_98g079 [Gracilaria domingensis]|nr:hypothetical protein FGB62_98g079 [Gracilaria domingensis]